MKIARWRGLALALGLAGCTTANLPHGAHLVGGGMMIDYTAPADGTAIVVERPSGRMLATKSLPEGETFHFEVDPGNGPIPTNAVLQLYFIPAKAKEE